MADAIENQLAKIDSIFAGTEGEVYTVWRSLSDSQRLSFLFAYYEYQSANEADLLTTLEGLVRYADEPGVLSGVYADGLSGEGNGIVALIPVHMGDFANKPQREDAIDKLLNAAEDELVAALGDEIYARKELRDRLTELDMDGLSGDRPLTLMLLADDVKFSPASAKGVRTFLAGRKPRHSHISFDITFRRDIVGLVLQTEGKCESVSSATIDIDNGQNVCRYGAEQSVVVNISAKSLRTLYDQYSYAGLFAQNLRLYVKNAAVDNSILQSISQRADSFWYFNNGIIIICDDYFIDVASNRIILTNFSIINGGQTTKLIGEADFTEDFHLLCKIIKNKYEDKNEGLNFISEVAAASNRQKPVKSEDLIANSPVQRILKDQLARVGIFCKIRRGETIDKTAYREPWQNTSNRELAQYLMSFMYQEPGLVRNSVSAVFSSRCLKLVFPATFQKRGHTYSSDLLADLLRFVSHYKGWLAHVKATTNDSDKIGLLNNSLHYIIALFGLTVKYRANRGLLEKAQDAESFMHHFRQFDYNHPIFAPTDDPEGQRIRIYRLLDSLCDDILVKAYSAAKWDNKGLVWSNFTKSDRYYGRYVIKRAVEFFRQNPFAPDAANAINTLTAQLLYRRTPDEIEEDRKLQSLFGTNYGPQKKPEAKVKDPSLRAKIKKSLLKLRKQAANTNNAKVADIFDNALLEKFCKFAPRTDADLEDLGFKDKFRIGAKIATIIEKHAAPAFG